ncbi:hypothetical protein AGDE_14494 [Angomonas deanei]|uniref:Uncharacterized protein n=1 Tax=Angomonas deanei TaxID=59799 RepID=A0A7G2CKV4_9TRYP|nr:hypothetical protein AGDE_14494 [Angomonas deanei]CAD2220456.1 hypothetical protein, conserved [Angomonas deanei]|eukprot:EPY20777.1 hypothetical protein AGDE_14494 [Angomonas deanei]
MYIVVRTTDIFVFFFFFYSFATFFFFTFFFPALAFPVVAEEGALPDAGPLIGGSWTLLPFRGAVEDFLRVLGGAEAGSAGRSPPLVPVGELANASEFFFFFSGFVLLLLTRFLGFAEETLAGRAVRRT